MPFDVSYLGTSLGDLTWLSDHETGAIQEDATTVYASDGSNLQVDSASDREMRRLVELEPLNALHLLNDEDMERLPAQMRQDILQRRQELKLADIAD